MAPSQGRYDYILLVGLGQKGNETLRDLQRYIADQEFPQNTAFYYLYLGQNFPEKSDALAVNEIVFSTEYDARDIKNGLERLDLIPDEQHRQPPEKNREWARLSLLLENIKVERTLEGIFNEIAGNRGRVNLFLLGAAGDSIVSGILVGLTLALRKTMRGIGIESEVHFTGLFTLPYSSKEEVEVANAYALLRDLYYAQRGIYSPISNPRETSSEKEPLLDDIIFLPPSPDNQNSTRNFFIFKWLASQFASNSKRKAEPFQEGNSDLAKGNGQCAILGFYAPQPSKDGKTLCPEVDLMALLEKACPPSALLSNFPPNLGRFDWTLYGSGPDLAFPPNSKEFLAQTLKKIFPEFKIGCFEKEDQLPQASVSIIEQPSSPEILCICERSGFDLSCLVCLEPYQKAYDELMKKGKFPQRNVELPDIPISSQIKIEPPVVLAEYAHKAKKLIITSTAPEKIRADFVVAPFSGDLSRPGVYSAGILEKAGQELEKNVSQLFSKPDHYFSQEGTTLRLQLANIGADSLLLLKLVPSSSESISKRVEYLIDAIFKEIPSEPETITVVLPLLALELPDPENAREIARIMWEKIPPFLIARPQNLVVIVSVCQPEAVAEFVQLITAENLNNGPASMTNGHKVERNYPFPIANPYHHLMYAYPWNKELSSFWDELFQEILIFLTSIAFCEALAIESMDWQKILSNCKKMIKDKMELGNWVGLIRNIGNEIGCQKKLAGDTGLFMPEMHEIYEDVLKNEKSLILKIKNRRDAWRKKKGEQPYGEELLTLIEKLGFLNLYRLVFVLRGPTFENNRNIFPCIDLTGFDPSFDHIDLECDPDLDLRPNKVYLVKEMANEVLNVDPFLKAEIKELPKYYWLYLHTLQGFQSADLSRGGIIYQLRTLEHCPFVPTCVDRERIGLRVDDQARRDLWDLINADPNRTDQIHRRQRTEYMRFIPPKLTSRK